MIYAIGKPGEPVRIYVDVPNLEALAANIGEGEDAVLVQEVGDLIISADGLSVEQRAKPLQEQQQALWADVKRQRERVEASGCSFLSHTVQTDAASRSKIESEALQATITALSGAFYTVIWTMADNTEVTLGREAMLALNSTVRAHVQACKARERDFRAMIFAEGITAAQLAAIDITAGWPSNT